MFKASNPLTASRVHRVWANESQDGDLIEIAIPEQFVSRVVSGLQNAGLVMKAILGSGLKHVFFFTPIFLGKWIQFDDRIFSDGLKKINGKYRNMEDFQFFDDVNHKRKPSPKTNSSHLKMDEHGCTLEEIFLGGGMASWQVLLLLVSGSVY